MISQSKIKIPMYNLLKCIYYNYNDDYRFIT